MNKNRGQESITSFQRLAKPVIAAVNGAAAGAGFSLALAADIRIAAPAARFNAAFIKVGLTGGDCGSSWMLPRVVGLGHAYEILLTGRFVDSGEAARIGLVNRVVPAEELLNEALRVAEMITENSPLGVALTKRVVQAQRRCAVARGGRRAGEPQPDLGRRHARHVRGVARLPRETATGVHRAVTLDQSWPLTFATGMSEITGHSAAPAQTSSKLEGD